MDEHMEGGHDIARLPNPVSQFVNQTSSDRTTIIMERKEEVEELSFVVAYLFSPAILIVAILLVRTISAIHHSPFTIHHSPSPILSSLHKDSIHSFDLILMVTYLRLIQ